MSNPCRKTARGFTLIEVIITLTIAALLMAVVVPYLGTAVTGTISPLGQLQDSLEHYQVVENMTAAYRQQQANKTLDLSAFQAMIGAEGTDQSNGFGAYHVVENRFILFDGADQEAGSGGSQHVLKVTVQAQGPGPLFTTLFTTSLP